MEKKIDKEKNYGKDETFHLSCLVPKMIFCEHHFSIFIINFILFFFFRVQPERNMKIWKNLYLFFYYTFLAHIFLWQFLKRPLSQFFIVLFFPKKNPGLFPGNQLVGFLLFTAFWTLIFSTFWRFSMTNLNFWNRFSLKSCSKWPILFQTVC